MRDSMYEEVRGTIIGDITFPYEFWVDEPRQEYQTKRGIPKRKIDHGHFRNDDEAKDWFKKHYPEEFKKHVIELRCFDQD